MADRRRRRAGILAAAVSAALALALAGSALAGPRPVLPAPTPVPAALPPGSVEAPGSNELVSVPQTDRGALSATTGSRIEDLFAAPTISASGRFVVFLRYTADGGDQVVVRDRTRRTTTVVGGPDANGPLQHPTISADGRFIAFTRSIDGPNPTEVVLVDRATGDEIDLPDLPRGYWFPDQPALSRTGQHLVVRSQSTEGTEVLLLDREAGRWEVISIDLAGRPVGASTTAQPGQPAISGDGNYVAFTALSGRVLFAEGVKGNEHRQVFLRDREAGRTVLVSRNAAGQAANGPSLTPAVSDDGGVVAFVSGATDLVAGIEQAQAHVYAWTRTTGALELISRATDGSPGNNASAHPTITQDGGSVGFASVATNLVPGDTTGGTTFVGAAPSATLVARGQIIVAGDVFVRDRSAARTTRVSVARGNQAEANGFSSYPSLSGTGRYVAFTSVATNLVARDANEQLPDVFVRDRPPRIRASPNPVDFGSVPRGSLGVTRPVTIRSTGIAAARIGDITIGGPNTDDFLLSANPCTGQVLSPGTSCEVQVLFIGTDTGDRAATLRVGSDAGDPVTVRLIGAVGKAKITVEPPVGPPGMVVIATGTGFPPNAPITLLWSVGITATPLQPVVSDAAGGFRAQVLVLHRDREGPRNLLATATVPGIEFQPVTARFLVVRPTAEPPTSGLVQVFTDMLGEPILIRR